MFKYIFHCFVGRTCELCGCYFASKKQQILHLAEIHGQKNSNKKQKVRKVLGKTDSHRLCELESCELEPIIEWIAEEEVELEFFEIPEIRDDFEIPIISDWHEWLTSPFTNID